MVGTRFHDAMDPGDTNVTALLLLYGPEDTAHGVRDVKDAHVNAQQVVGGSGRRWRARVQGV